MTGWERPGACSTGACVEVRITDTTVEVRDSKQLISPVLTLDLDEWHRIINSIYRTGHPRCVAIVGNDHIWVGHDTDGNPRTLTFTRDEIRAFVTAVHHGQYRQPAVTR